MANPSTAVSASATEGVLQLGYLGFEVSAPDVWEKFATEVLGLRVAQRLAGGGFTLQMDGYAHRLLILPGGLDDVAVIGWQVKDEAALQAVALRVAEAGCEVMRGSAEQAAARKVAGLVSFLDPAGIPTELFHGLERAAQPFTSELVRAGFVAEERGLGHVVVSAQDKQRSGEFYRSALGFRLSDNIACEYFGHKVDLSFFHVNPRHHSVAIGDRQRKRIHHFMIEAVMMDDVGLCFDRALRAGVPIMQTLGRHPNDRMFSFYAKTPSGVQFEFGWGGREVDDASWQTTTYDRISEWGHHPPIAFAPREKRS